MRRVTSPISSVLRAAWRFAPRSEVFERFVQTVMRRWRSAGGEPDIGLDLLTWLPAEGFELRSVSTFVDVLSPKTFLNAGLERLVDLGAITGEEATRVREEFAILETTPNARNITPAVIELIAVKI